MTDRRMATIKMVVMERSITIEAYLEGAWHPAALVTLKDVEAGWRGVASVDYLLDYCLAFNPEIKEGVIGPAALGVRLPVSLTLFRFGHWPSFLADFLPQGQGRKALAEILGLREQPRPEANDVAMLLRVGSGPIGNLRVREAWEDEQTRLAAVPRLALTEEELFARDERFVTLAREFAVVASGSSGVQGSWPKMLLTKDADGRWLPDPMVPDERAADHAIAKWVGGRSDRDRLILAAEAPYMELARWFGLRCGRPLRHENGLLLIPRFDRRVEGGHVVRSGQESILSAIGIAEAGHSARHEDYLEILKKFCSNPAEEVTEYVLRDLLNIAAGNTDNHGRNTALAKDPDGTVRLTPLFDFCPMILSDEVIPRSTTWGCMRAPGMSDFDPDWGLVCEVAAEGVMPVGELRERLAAKTENLRMLPEKARDLGIADEVVNRAMQRCTELADRVAILRRMPS